MTVFTEKTQNCDKLSGDSCYESKRKYKRSLLHRSTLNTNKNNTRTNKLITDSSNHYGYEIPLGQSRPKSQNELFTRCANYHFSNNFHLSFLSFLYKLQKLVSRFSKIVFSFLFTKTKKCLVTSKIIAQNDGESNLF